MSLVNIVLVNYNNHDDTIECIDSIFANNEKDISIVVVDNSESTDSIDKISSWAKGVYKPNYKTPETLTKNLSNQLPQTVQIIFTDDIEKHLQLNQKNQTQSSLAIIKNPANFGFAKANNIGIKYAMFFSPKYLWLLNNDTIIEQDSLTQLLNFYKEKSHQGIKAGLIGSKILFYKNPEIIQSVGDRFNILTTWSYHIGLNQKDIGQFDTAPIKVNYPYGASLFLSADYVREVGLMCEDYFLYFEELDWVKRGKKKSYEIFICTKSKIFHKQGLSTGKKIGQQKPLFIACLMYSNLLKFYWKHYPFLYPVAWLRLFLKMNKNILAGNTVEAKLILQILFGFRNCKSCANK